jgi:hypothetical protein
MIEFIFSLHAGTATSGAPLLTIPIGGRSQ